MVQTATIEGVLERVVFYNEENGYTVGLLQGSDSHDPVTVVGTLMGINNGQNLQLHGTWKEHPKFGRQFQFESYRVVPPSTLIGLKRYLASGVLKGVGKKTAERLVKKFGLSTLEIMEKEPERLKEIEGIGRKKLRQILSSFREQRDQQEIMVFLQSYGVTAGQAKRIYEEYGEKTIAFLRSNPYQLSRDVFGIGFKTADQIALNLGIPRDSEARADAGLLYVLDQLSNGGHVCYPSKELLREAQQILEVSLPILEKALARQIRDRSLIQTDQTTPMIYLARYFRCEVEVANRLTSMLKNDSSIPEIDTEKSINWFEKQSGLQLSPGQKEAIHTVIGNRVSIITGGPGVGKTTVINTIIQVLSTKNLSISLGAPTGRAAKRLTEATGCPAKTLHRMLRYNPAINRFNADEDSPLEEDVFIIDECSMIDISLMYHLLKALPLKAHLVLVGDADQLPSVGPGNVLRDIIRSGKVPVASLNVIFRQSDRSTIVEWAHAINRGDVPRIPEKSEDLSDLYFVQKEEPEEILRIVLHLCTERIPERFGLDPIKHIQVLTPMHRGTLGVTNLNMELRNAVNPQRESSRKTPNGFQEGDKVMQIRNNYEREVFNGDIGYITIIDPVDEQVTVRYDERNVEYSYGSLSEIVPAYAISVHKSQGSEYPAVVLPLSTQHFVLLQRNLLYTAITRGRRLVVLVGTQRALRIAVQEAGVRQRFTQLKERLTGEFTS